MVYAREEVGSIEPAGNNSGFNTRAGVARLIEAVINRSYIDGRDSDDVGIIAPRLLEVGEEKRAVTFKRAANARAVLRLRE